MTQAFLAGVEIECPGVRLNLRRDPARRDSQVSFSHPHGYAVMQTLIVACMIGEFRPTDVLRFGIAALYNDLDDVGHATYTQARILREGSWNDRKVHHKTAVT